MDGTIREIAHEKVLLSAESVRLSLEATGGPALWFLWKAGSDQAFARPLSSIPAVPTFPMTSVSISGQSIERDARLLQETWEQWWQTPQPRASRRARTPLGRRLAELRERIKDSGAPLLSSWEEVDRELEERRGEQNAERRA